MRVLEVEGGRTLSGLVVAPPDKSITHRALFFAALGTGECAIAPLGGGADNRATAGALRALGVEVALAEGRAVVRGVGGPAGLKPASGPIDCMNSGTTMRVLSGILAATRFASTLTGDASLRSRPMSRLSPLIEMGARIEGRAENGKIYPPITVTGGALRGMEHRLTVASAQVKTALILAGLYASGESVIIEPARSRDHTERMLGRLGAPVREREDGAIVVSPISSPWRAEAIEVAPDLSSAAFLLGAAISTRSPGLRVETGVNPTRAGVLEVLEAMGAQITREPLADRGGEPVACLQLDAGRLAGTTIEGGRTLRAIDEIPLLAAVALFADGRTVIKDAEELRVKESDRLSATRKVLEAFGAKVQETKDGLEIEGGAKLRPAEVDALGDHRIAMMAAVIALGVPGVSKIRGAEHIDVSYPGFSEGLERLGARVKVVDAIS